MKIDNIITPEGFNQSENTNCWRLVHDGSRVIALFESTGYTTTKDNLYCATTEVECLAEIDRLGLIYTPDNE